MSDIYQDMAYGMLRGVSSRNRINQLTSSAATPAFCGSAARLSMSLLIIIGDNHPLVDL
jgi:hypothetical protein